jgi:hypothetical protein
LLRSVGVFSAGLMSAMEISVEKDRCGNDPIAEMLPLLRPFCACR